MANEAIRKEPLTKKERNNLFRRYMTFNAPGFDYVYYMGKSWPWWLKPVLNISMVRFSLILRAFSHFLLSVVLFLNHGNQ